MNTDPEFRQRAKAADEERTQLAALAHATRVATLGELAASIAHEIVQPLAAIVINGDACLQWLDRDMPDLAAARGFRKPNDIRRKPRRGNPLPAPRAVAQS